MSYAVKQKNLWILGVILGLGVTAYDNLSTWLQPVIQTIGMGQVAGTVVALTLVLGLIGILIIPNMITKRDLRTIYLRIVATVVFLIFAVLAFVASKTTLYGLLPLGCFVMLPHLPDNYGVDSKFYVKSHQGIATGFMAFVGRIIQLYVIVAIISK